MLKSLHHREDPQHQMTDAEVMFTAIVAALDYGGHLEKARRMLQVEGYIPNMLGKSRFNRRWHDNADLFLTLFSLLGETWKQLNRNSIYVIDNFPVAVCDNYRIQRCRLYRGETAWPPRISVRPTHFVFGLLFDRLRFVDLYDFNPRQKGSLGVAVG